MVSKHVAIFCYARFVFDKFHRPPMRIRKLDRGDRETILQRIVTV